MYKKEMGIAKLEQVKSLTLERKKKKKNKKMKKKMTMMMVMIIIMATMIKFGL